MKTNWAMSVRPGLPTVIFPNFFDTTDLEEVSSVTDNFAVYVNVVTGEVVDCENFYKQMVMEANQP